MSIPVEPLGFSSPGVFYLGTRNALVSLDFLDEDRLLFTFRVPGLIHRDPHGGSSDERKIRAVLLRLPQGAVEAETVWTVHDRARYLYAVGDGKFLFRDLGDVKLGDASLELKPYLRFPGPIVSMQTDPSHQYLVAESNEPQAATGNAGEVPSPPTAEANVSSDENGPQRPDMVLRILRREDGKVMLVSRIRFAIQLPINDDGDLEAERSTGEGRWLVRLSHFAGGSTPLGTVESNCTPLSEFVSSKVFLLTTCKGEGDRELFAMSTNGHRMWEMENPSQFIWPQLATSANGLRLARETLKISHGINASAPLGTDDIKGQDVQVVDVATGKQVLRADASPIFDVGGNVAISPSGRRVAILMEGGIQVFELPAPPTLPASSETEAGH